MASTRIRKGVSLGQQTVATLDRIVAEGRAESVSAAIDLAVDEYRRRRIDSDLIAAAHGRDTETETQQPGVLGGTDTPTNTAPAWTALDS